MITKLYFIALILATISLNTIAQVLLKSGAAKSLLNLYLLGGVSTYGLSTLAYILVLRKLNLSLAYPIIIGSTVIATTIAGSLILGERVTHVNWIGIGLMISGIFAISLKNI
jgi:multidrug transporter EmrE-like cation transporter